MENAPTDIIIDCSTCVMFESAHCAECIVTYLCRQEPEVQNLDPMEQEALGDSRPVTTVFDLAEFRAMKVLAEAGLVPTLRHRAAQ